MHHVNIHTISRRKLSRSPKSYKRWSFSRVSNSGALTGNVLNWRSLLGDVRLRGVVASGGSTLIKLLYIVLKKYLLVLLEIMHCARNYRTLLGYLTKLYTVGCALPSP